MEQQRDTHEPGDEHHGDDDDRQRVLHFRSLCRSLQSVYHYES